MDFLIEQWNAAQGAVTKCENLHNDLKNTIENVQTAASVAVDVASTVIDVALNVADGASLACDVVSAISC